MCECVLVCICSCVKTEVGSGPRPPSVDSNTCVLGNGGGPGYRCTIEISVCVFVCRGVHCCMCVVGFLGQRCEKGSILSEDYGVLLSNRQHHTPVMRTKHAERLWQTDKSPSWVLFYNIFLCKVLDFGLDL